MFIVNAVHFATWPGGLQCPSFTTESRIRMEYSGERHKQSNVHTIKGGEKRKGVIGTPLTK